MQEKEDFYARELVHNLIKANQKVAKNLLDNFSGYLYDDKDMALTYLSFANKVMANPKETYKMQKKYFSFVQDQQELWKRMLERQTEGKEFTPMVTPKKGDKRFNAPEWNENYYDFIKQNYLLASQLFSNIIEDLEMDPRKKRKLNFYTKHFLDALSPSNFVITNPEVLKKAKETNGESLKEGFNNLLEDIQKGRLTQTDDTAFELGKNLAITKGSVIFRNELMELIQYAPLTEQVYSIPLLIIPPWINKYYILDLQDHNSLVKFAVEQGNTVFMISWKNPTADMGYLSFDDYVDLGLLKAMDVIEEITKISKINALGFCLGGTLLGVSLAVLASKKDQIINSATFLAAMHDFTDVGPMGDVIDEALVRKLERGELMKGGVMSGHEMERAFNLIRPNDLIWNYVVNNYLKGEKPSAFDVLFWTNDNTNLPAKMYLFYLREMVLENKLSKRNAVNVCGVPINMRKIKTPSMVIGMQEDHISPAITTFTTTEILSGPSEFVLGGSGHVMGVANPPAKNKYGYLTDGVLDEGFDEWQRTAKSNEGSWWTHWSKWLSRKSGKKITARKLLGNRQYAELEPAPGSYVMEKID